MVLLTRSPASVLAIVALLAAGASATVACKGSSDDDTSRGAVKEKDDEEGDDSDSESEDPPAETPDAGGAATDASVDAGPPVETFTSGECGGTWNRPNSYVGISGTYARSGGNKNELVRLVIGALQPVQGRIESTAPYERQFKDQKNKESGTVTLMPSNGAFPANFRFGDKGITYVLGLRTSGSGVSEICLAQGAGGITLTRAQ